jgi:ribosome-associated protein
MRDVEVGADGIRLGQFLKFAGLVGSGGEAKSVLQEGLVLVNAAPESRRGRQLARGDVVAIGEQQVRVA